MKIPNTVKVGPHVYQVVLEDNLASDNNKMGETVITRSIIKMDANLSQSQLEDTLIHEILHAINDQVEFVKKGDDTEELAVSRIAPLLLQVIKDNKEIFE